MNRYAQMLLLLSSRHQPPSENSEGVLNQLQAEEPAPEAPAGSDTRAPALRDLREPDAVQDELAGPRRKPVGPDVQPEVRVHETELVPPSRNKPGCSHRRGTWCTCVKTWSRP